MQANFVQFSHTMEMDAYCNDYYKSEASKVQRMLHNLTNI